MKFIPIILICLALQACGHFEQVPAITINKVVKIEKEALEPCGLLTEAVVVNTFEDGLIAYGDLAARYGACANKQNTSIKLLKQFGNIK